MRRGYPAPRVDADDRRWQSRSACLGQAEYFDDDDGNAVQRPWRENQAKAICAQCPVRPRCAAYALGEREPHGIWGGFSESQRRRLLSLGWQDALDRRGLTVDVAQLEARLLRTDPIDRRDHDKVPGKSVAS
jgi:WhiB family redox-sensing transcriptional regulator